MYTILVVEDEFQIEKILKEFLTRMGFKVITIPDGERAIEVLNSALKIDLMLLDMKMPKVGGFDVLKQMKKINRRHPVIILTGSLDEKEYIDNVETLGYSAQDILSKPVDLFLLLGIIKNKLGIV